VRGDEPEVSLVRWLWFQCNCHGCTAGSVSWHAHLDVLCEKVGSPRSSHTVKVTELCGNISYYINTPAPSLCPGKVPLITLVKTTSVVGNLHKIRYCVNNDLCSAWNVTCVHYHTHKHTHTHTRTHTGLSPQGRAMRWRPSAQ